MYHLKVTLEVMEYRYLSLHSLMGCQEEGPASSGDGAVVGSDRGSVGRAGLALSTVLGGRVCNLGSTVEQNPSRDCQSRQL